MPARDSSAASESVDLSRDQPHDRRCAHGDDTHSHGRRGSESYTNPREQQHVPRNAGGALWDQREHHQRTRPLRRRANTPTPSARTNGALTDARRRSGTLRVGFAARTTATHDTFLSTSVAVTLIRTAFTARAEPSLPASLPTAPQSSYRRTGHGAAASPSHRSSLRRVPWV